MRITINAFGSRGDVQPYVALGKGLREAGHYVRLSTHRIFEAFVLEHNLAFFPMEGDPRQVLLTQAVAELGNNPFRVNRWVAENFKPVLEEVFRITLDAAQGADLLLNSALSFAGWHVAEKLGIPSIGAYLQPMTPTRAFHNYSAPPPPSWLPFKGLCNYLSTKLSDQSFFHMLLPLLNASRREVLDLPPLSAAYYWRVDSASATTFSLTRVLTCK